MMKIPRPGVRAALTLTELLVIIGITGILTALLLTAISQAKARAQRIRCVNNLHQFGVAIQNFVAANNAYPSVYAARIVTIQELGWVSLRAGDLTRLNLIIVSWIRVYGVAHQQFFPLIIILLLLPLKTALIFRPCPTVIIFLVFLRQTIARTRSTARTHSVCLVTTFLTQLSPSANRKWFVQAT